MKSCLRVIGGVKFPQCRGQRIHMQGFKQARGIPKRLRSWGPTIESMLGNIKTNGSIYLTIDQGPVYRGRAQRRSGVHIDGSWIDHDRKMANACGYVNWSLPQYEDAVILASDMVGCKAYLGDFNGAPGPGGDCSHIDLCGAKEIILEPNIAYAGNVNMIHESIPVFEDGYRTMVRLTLLDYDIASMGD